MNSKNRPIMLFLTGPRGEDKMAYAREHIKRLTGSLEYIDVWSIAHGLDPLTTPSCQTIREAAAWSIVLAGSMIKRKKSFSMECRRFNRRIQQIIELATENGYEVKVIEINGGTTESFMKYIQPTEPVGEDDWDVLSNGQKQLRYHTHDE